MERQQRPVSFSYTEQVQILISEHINGQRRLFGGRLMEWIDIVAAVVARRHSGCNVTTACVDHLQFLSSAKINSTIVLVGRITYTGNTSMEVRVDTFVETLEGERTLVNRAYLVLVALDENEQPTTVPSLLLTTEEEKEEFNNALERKKIRQALRKKIK